MPQDRLRYIRAILASHARTWRGTYEFVFEVGKYDTTAEMAIALNSIQFPDDIILTFRQLDRRAIGQPPPSGQTKFSKEFIDAIRTLRNVKLDGWYDEHFGKYLNVAPQPSLHRKLRINNWHPETPYVDGKLAGWIQYLHTLVLTDVRLMFANEGLADTALAISRSSLEEIYVSNVPFQLISFPRSIRRVTCERTQFADGLVASLAHCPLLESITLKKPDIGITRRLELVRLGLENGETKFPQEFRECILRAEDRSMLRKIDTDQSVDDTIVKFMEDPRNRLDELRLRTMEWNAFERVIRSPHASRLRTLDVFRIHGDSSDRGRALMRHIIMDTNITTLTSYTHEIEPQAVHKAFERLNVIRAIFSGRYIRGRASKLFHELPWEYHIQDIIEKLGWSGLNVLADAEFVRNRD